MNGTRIKCLLVLIALSIIGFGPLSLTCLIGLYVVIARPRWFLKVVHGLYADDADAPRAGYSQRGGGAGGAMAT
ncbi:MAG: uncharacterized protein H6R26_1994, partial [Proteobacteria bacterium]|nr:uncharacterized protein [Pseudomonadota bacterium]